MTQHNHAQKELAIREREVAKAAERVEEVDRRLAAAQARASALGVAADAARDALRVAAGDGDAKALGAARKAIRAAEEEYELAAVELEGVGARLAQVEEELALRRREMCRIGARIAEEAACGLEADARELFGAFAALLEQRHALALLASTLASEATGRYSEPVRYSDEFCIVGKEGQGFGSILSRHRLTSTFSPAPELQPARLESLLDIDLPRAVEAAE